MKIQLTKIALLAAGMSVATFGLDAARKLETPVYTYTPASTSTPKVTEAEVEKVIDQVMSQAQQGTAAGENLPWWQRAKAHITRNWEKYVTGGVAATAIATLATLFATEKRRADTVTNALAENIVANPKDKEDVEFMANKIGDMNKEDLKRFINKVYTQR
jgi:hypothetical protein